MTKPSNSRMSSAASDPNGASERTEAQADGHSFASTVANFFRKNPDSQATKPIDPPAQGAAVPEVDLREQAMSRPHLAKHWQAIKAEGISASEFIAFLQPLADLEGIAVSYIYSDTDGKERIYNHRREDQGFSNPLSQAIREKKLSKEKALSFALNEQGKVWIESNFIELK